MRASIVFAFLAFVFTLVGAMPSGGSNARRLAEGLPPLPPARRSPTPVELAPRHKPSGTSQCNSGPVQCCNKVASSNDKGIKQLLGLLGINLSATQTIGLNCSPIGLGLGGNSCNKQTVCCQNNGFNGLVSIGCSPINLKL
ncbi:hypothetical protein EST38_g4992 [Candolleomyces aberdarensis]|uniref:Hydrophobin n=1 Tax=Candolleomyces aberdarensis TaxID=2316362 RepID=A0A4Q2DL58_9AGAR|nr:hypothetical protein EST38_g4992 [Candolleomyces aberdarensis]